MTQPAGQRTAGIVLAAGVGSRFGGGKMMAEVNGRPMLQHVLDIAALAELVPVIVVLGNDAAQIEAAIEWRSEIRVRNEQPERGISSSLKLGLEAVNDSDRALILLGDQPLVMLDQIRRIVAADADPSRPIVVPLRGGQAGNPVLLEREAWPSAAALNGDRGMSQLFATHSDLVRYVDVEGTSSDIDTPQDLARITAATEPTAREAHADGR